MAGVSSFKIFNLLSFKLQELHFESILLKIVTVTAELGCKKCAKFPRIEHMSS